MAGTGFDMITLRPELDEDDLFIRSLYHEGRAEEVAASGWPTQMSSRFLDDQFRLQRVHFTANHPNADYSVIESPTTRGAIPAPIGRLYVERGGKTWRLLEIGLLRTAQGHGIGTALIRQLQREAKASAASLALSVLHANVRASSLYTKLGFIDAASLVPSHRAMIWRP